MFSLNTNVRMPAPAEVEGILRTVAPDIKRLFQDVDTIAPSGLPKEMSCGMLVGWLRAKGYSWQEAFTAMDDLIKVLTAKGQMTAAVTPQQYPPRSSFKVELITCCVGCVDYLETCLKRNMWHFDHTIVVTDTTDLASRELAQRLGADVLVTDRFYVGGKRFDRGSAYNRALDLVRYKDWVTFMDVDIVLHGDHRLKLEQHGLRNNVFYGCDRLNLTTPAAREAFLCEGDTSSALVDSTTEWGFGYYQLFNWTNPFLTGRPPSEPIYPSSPDVFTSDHLFRHRFGGGHTMTPAGLWTWDASHQQRLPWPCYHLGSNGVGTVPDTLRYLAPAAVS